MTDWLATPSEQANPASATHWPGPGARTIASRKRAAQVAALIGADAARDHLHLRRHRGQQPRAAGRGGARRVALRRERVGISSARASSTSRCSTPASSSRETVSPSRCSNRTSRVACLPEAVRSALRDDTLLVSLMLANNEIGVLNDIAAIGELAAERGFLLHTDASQAVGKLPVDVVGLGVDLLSLTAHKFYGPKGIGALYVREQARPRIAPIQFGGGQERGLRPGTLPTHQIVGLGVAAALAARASAARCRACARSRQAALAGARDRSRVSSSTRQLEQASARTGECVVRGRRGRKPGHRPFRARGVDRLRLQLGHARAQLRAARARPQTPSSRRARCGISLGRSRRPRTSTRPPPLSAPKSRGCARPGRETRTARRGGAESQPGRAACWRGR